jgi:cholesterol oxidase
MGTDAADGEVYLGPSGGIKIRWPGGTSVELYDQISAARTQMSSALGASYHHPPLFNPRTGEGLLTAHPLGGCNVGTDAATAVCAHTGEAFGVPGLFVADRSSIPTALAKNPSFTISAMAGGWPSWF